jgi:aconitate hydratase
MVASGLLAKKAVERGLRVNRTVKTSLAPGSTVVTEYLQKAGLMSALETLGFHVVGYGCTTCIGNSGALPDEVAKAVSENDIVASAVLSGNRNFEGRVNPLTRTNYLASPPLVVAYAIAGTTAIDLHTDPIGKDTHGKPVFLKDIWPSNAEIEAAVLSSVTPELFASRYADVWKGSKRWQEIASSTGELYQWDEASTYIRKAPFFDEVGGEARHIESIQSARVLGFFGDSITTDHISPAGSIAGSSPAGKYLLSLGVEKSDWNSYGARRGNHEVMMRGTFANIRIKNKLVPGKEGNLTRHIPSGEELSFYDASQRYISEGSPLIILAGKEYGSGGERPAVARCSSRCSTKL